MGRRIRQRQSGNALPQASVEDGGGCGWEIDHADHAAVTKPPTSASTDEQMTALVDACTHPPAHPNFHDSKNMKANNGATAVATSHSAENVGHPIKRSLSWLELPSELFGDDKPKTDRRKQAVLACMVLSLLACSTFFFRGASEEDVMIEQREIDFGDHKKSLNQVAHSTEQFLQKSEFTKGNKKKIDRDDEDEEVDDEASDRPIASRNRTPAQDTQMQQYLLTRNANKETEEEVRDEDRQNFVSAHTAAIEQEAEDNGRPIREIPQDAQIRTAIMGSHIDVQDVDANLKYVSPIAQQYDPTSSDEIPLFWEVSGGSASIILRNVLSCLGVVVASGAGGEGTDTLQEVDIEGNRYVNVNTYTVSGLQRAKDLGLASADLADVIFTPLFHPALQMFDASNHKARPFTILRHPIERSISTFLTLQANNDPAVEGMSLEDYAASPLLESNWMTRTLSGQMYAEVDPQHLDIAQTILTDNFIVGLHDDRYGSVARFENFFGWEYDESQTGCRNAMFQEEMNRPDMAKQLFSEGGPAIKLMWEKNELDIQLYDFADALYKDQAGLFADVK